MAARVRVHLASHGRDNCRLGQKHLKRGPGKFEQRAEMAARPGFGPGSARAEYGVHRRDAIMATGWPLRPELHFLPVRPAGAGGRQLWERVRECRKCRGGCKAS